MTQHSYRLKDYETFIGLDVDKNSFAYTVGDKFQLNNSKKMPSNPEHLYNYINKHFDPTKVVCAYEAGPTGFHLYDYLLLFCFSFQNKSVQVSCIIFH